ncbi:MAG: 50S ribosomal protein L10 [Alphaproteobacteria bacterium]|nr:50S ribosomal protein L10 [Alphaproteobacteria bacterium]
MKREDKSSLISSLQGHIKAANGIFVIENHGTTVKDFEALRRELAPITSVFKVVKNRLFKLAVAGTSFEGVSGLMKRPTAVAIANDPLAVTKVLAKFAETHPSVTIVGGKMDADLLDAKAIEQLSKLPSLNEIRGTIARILIEPASRIARVSAEYGKK